MKLIVGLGNKGKEYDNTRHNMGFYFIDKYAKDNNIKMNKKKFDGEYGEGIIDLEKVILLKPQLYMNLSGEVIRKYVDYFKIDIDDILIIHDDLDINVGNFKLKSHGSSAGHNGLKDIEANLNTKNYKRLKIGISNNKMFDTKDYVLGKLNNEEMVKVMELSDVVSSIITDFITMDFSKVEAKYNTKNR